VTERIQEVAAPILWALGLELVEVVCVGQGSRTVVRLFIDKPGGVTLDDCQQAHESLGPALDVADPLPHTYILEVSSPGLDRPLRRLQDYRRSIGKRITLKLRQPYAGQWRVVGELLDVDEQAVTVSTDGTAASATIRLTFSEIVEGKREVTF
jgi:ribosome maturation factor RimP